MVYTQKELDAILDLTSKGLSKDDAVAELVESKPVAKIAELVKEYFNVDDLIPVTREQTSLAPAVVFYYLVCDICFMPRDTKVHKTAIKYTGHDRTTFLAYVSIFERDDHKLDNRYVYGDALYNHFLKIKGKINQKDYTELMIKPFIRKGGVPQEFKPHFEKVMAEKSKEIEEFIGERSSLKRVNDEFFQFPNSSSLRHHLKTKRPDLNERVRYERGTRISRVMEEFSDNITRRIDLGDTSKELNDRYFGYDGVSSFRKSMRQEQNELYLQILENERRRKRKRL